MCKTVQKAMKDSNKPQPHERVRGWPSLLVLLGFEVGFCHFLPVLHPLTPRLHLSTLSRTPTQGRLIDIKLAETGRKGAQTGE